MDNRRLGVVKFWNFSRGFGFITLDNGEDVFVHCTAILGDGENNSLYKNQEVELTVIEGERGLQAREVLALTEEFYKD